MCSVETQRFGWFRRWTTRAGRIFRAFSYRRTQLWPVAVCTQGGDADSPFHFVFYGTVVVLGVLGTVVSDLLKGL